MKEYTQPTLEILRHSFEANFCASFDSNDNTEIWTIEPEETI